MLTRCKKFAPYVPLDKILLVFDWLFIVLFPSELNVNYLELTIT